MIVTDAVLRWLADQGHTDLHLDHMPDAPDEAVAVVATGGTDVAGAVAGWTDPTVQILVRGTHDPRTSASQAQTIADDLQSLAGDVADSQGGDGRVAGVELVQPHPVRVGLDQAGRHRHSINARIMLDR